MTRMLGWLVMSIVLLLTVVLSAPETGEVTAWGRALVILHKINLITIAGYVAYWLDRRVFHYARPAAILRQARCEVGLNSIAVHYGVFAAAMLRRALIMAAAMIAIATGL